MSLSTKTVISVAVAVLAVAVPASRAEMTMGESIDFPHAGIALSFPSGYEPQLVGTPFDIARAILRENDQPVQAVTLAAFPLADADITAEALADEMVAAQQQNLAVRNVEVLSKAAMKVAGQAGAARFISYTYRGEETFAASVIFCRTLEDRTTRLEYILTVEATAERKDKVLPVLGEVVKSVRLLTVVRPIDIPIKLSTHAVEAGAWGTLRVPHGWYAQLSPAGVSLGQTDYLLGGEATVSASVLVAPLPPDVETPQAHAEVCVQAATQAAEQEGVVSETISQGACTLGEAAAWELVIEQRSPTPATAPTAATAPAATTAPTTSPAEPNNVVIVQRSVMLEAAEATEAKRCLSVVLVCVDAPPRRAQAVMEALAEGVAVRGAVAPASQPAEPVATTVPAIEAGAAE